MNESPLPNEYDPKPARTKQSRGVWKIVSVVGGLLVASAGLGMLASFAWPKILRIREAAAEASRKREEKLRPSKPLTGEQIEALERYGQTLEDAFADQDTEKLMRLQDIEALADLVCLGVEGGRDVMDAREGFIRGLRKKEAGIFSQLVMGKVTFLRTRERDGFPSVLLRVQPESGGLNYVEVLVRPEGAEFLAVDVFDYVLSTSSSQLSRHLLASLLAKSGVARFASWLGLPTGDQVLARQFLDIIHSSEKKDFSSVVKLYQKLPVETQSQRFFFIAYLQALMNLNQSESGPVAEQYKAALRAAPEVLGKDNGRDLLMFDLLFMEQDFQGAEECLKRMDAIIGGDVELTLLRGNTRIAMGDVDGALALADEVEKAEPGLAGTVDLRIAVYLKRKDFRSAVGQLRAFWKSSGVALDRQSLTDPIYSELLKSPEFAAWEKETAPQP